MTPSGKLSVVVAQERQALLSEVVSLLYVFHYQKLPENGVILWFKLFF